MNKTGYSQVSTRKNWMVASAIILFILIVDQFIKYLVKTHMYLYQHIDITSWFQIFFTENRGMAYGMQFGGTWLLAVFRIIFVIVLMMGLTKAIKRHLSLGLIVCLSMIIAGALGNIIDNCVYGLIFTTSYPEGPNTPLAQLVIPGNGYGEFLSGRVVDMFYFPLFTWPEWVPFLGGQVFFNAIFNFADSSITCGALGLFMFFSHILNFDKKSSKTAGR